MPKLKLSALQSGNVEQFKKIVDEKEIATEGEKYLLHACLYGYLDIVKYLVEKGVAINNPNDAGKTPLHIAVRYKHMDVAKYLLENGADINIPNTKNGDTPLHIAVETLNFELIYYLLENGANVSAQNSHGETPLHTAALMQNPKLVDYLIEKAGANEEIIDVYGKKAIDRAKAFLNSDLTNVFSKEKRAYNATIELRKEILKIKPGQSFETIDRLVNEGANFTIHLCPRYMLQ